MASSSSRAMRVAYCGGRACPKCDKCCDWYYSMLDHTDCDSSVRAYAHHLGPLVGPLYQWHRRIDATCGYRAYPHYVYYVAYHGDCPYGRSGCSNGSKHPHSHIYPRSAVHGPQICHCKATDKSDE
jgi:hypothetical protein